MTFIPVAFSRGFVTSVVMLLTAFASGQLSAQSQTKTDILMEEILITSTKKSHGQALQEAPISITALSAEELELKKIKTLDDMAVGMPNVNLTNGGTFKGTANFSIRGSSLNSTTTSVEPVVGTFVDGIYAGVNVGVLTNLLDVGTIEVLRGPQGVLFGRNVVGGAVLINNARPQREFSLDLNGRWETGLDQTYTAVINGSVTDNLLARLAMSYNDDDGWFDNEAGGPDISASETYVIRPSFTYVVSETSEHTLIVEHGKIDGDGITTQGWALYDDHDIGLDEPGFADIEWNQVTLESKWDIAFGNGSITNLLGYRDVESWQLTDIDSSPSNQYHAYKYEDQDQISEEFRYNGTFDKFDVTAGLYYFTQDTSFVQRNVLFAGALRQNRGGNQDHDVYGVFASVDYLLTPSFTISAGARYSYEEKDVEVSPDSLNSCDVFSRTCSSYLTDSESWSFVTPQIGFSWRFSDGKQLYGYYAKGFRSGGYNFAQRRGQILPSGQQVVQPPVDEEENYTIEFGLKTEFNDRRTILNTAVFYNETQDLQKVVNLGIDATGATQVVANTADAKMAGVEIEFLHRITEKLTLNTSMGYIDAEYTDVFFDLNGDGVVDSVDKSLDLSRTPEWTGSLSLTYEHALPMGGSVLSRVSYSHQDHTFQQDSNDLQIPAVDLVDLLVTYYSLNEQWSVSLYGKNLTNDESYGGASSLPTPPFAGGSFSPINEGRKIGMEIKYSL